MAMQAVIDSVYFRVGGSSEDVVPPGMQDFSKSKQMKRVNGFVLFICAILSQYFYGEEGALLPIGAPRSAVVPQMMARAGFGLYNVPVL